jgi:hypothetical protein
MIHIIKANVHSEQGHTDCHDLLEKTLKILVWDIYENISIKGGGLY